MENLYSFLFFVPQREEKRLKSLRNDTVWGGFERFVICTLLGYITRRSSDRANIGGGNLPRMSKKQKLEWSFFLNDRGRKVYNRLCRKCEHDCKQSFRAIVIECPQYLSKRRKKY